MVPTCRDTVVTVTESEDMLSGLVLGSGKVTYGEVREPGRASMMISGVGGESREWR